MSHRIYTPEFKDEAVDQSGGPGGRSHGLRGPRPSGSIIDTSPLRLAAEFGADT